VEGGTILEKIVIRTDQPEPAAHLLSLLNRMFPECEIQIVMDTEAPESQDLADWSQYNYWEKEHG
jgi:hypothetical protein